MNVSIDVLDIRQVNLPHSQYIVATSVVLVVAMIVYIVSTCANLFKLCEEPAAEVHYGQLEYDTDVTL